MSIARRSITLSKPGTAEVCKQLRSRLAELEEAILMQLQLVDADSSADQDSELISGRRAAVAACVEAGLMCIERPLGPDDTHPIPPAAILQARTVAHARLNLTPILHRYIAGYKVFWDFLLEEVQRSKLDGDERMMLLRQASVALASLLGHLVSTVADVYTRETRRMAQSREQRTAEIVQALLSCASAETDELDYDVNGDHVGLIATGNGALKALQRFAVRSNRPILTVPRGDSTVWAWVAGAARISPRELASTAVGDVRLAVGEPARGRSGFRATHRQAQAARLVANEQRRAITCYADVLLLIPAVQDKEHGDALIAIYLSPLDEAVERKPTLKETLRAYLDAEGNTTSTAAKLHVDRRTAMTRLRTIEQRLGFPLHHRQAELELALRLDELRSCAADVATTSDTSSSPSCGSSARPAAVGQIGE